MAGVTPPNSSIRWSAAAAAVAFFGGIFPQTSALAEADMFQQAINYVFTGTVDPPDAPEIVDQKSCVVVRRDPKFNRYIRYHLGRFKMDEALFEKRYSGSRVSYELDVKGDDVIVEYLNPDKKTVLSGNRSAQIPLPGDIDQTQKALRIISGRCSAEKPKAPF